MGKLEGKIPLGRPRQMKNNITMNVQEVGWKDMTWPDLTQDVTMAGSCEQSTEYLNKGRPT